jgi:hypothetical protein
MEPSVTRMSPTPSTDFSPQSTLGQRGQRIEPQVRRQVRKRGVQPEHHVRNPRFGKHNNLRRHCPDSKRAEVKVSGSGMHDTQLAPPFRAPTNILRYATKELCSVAAQYATGNEATKLLPTRGSREVTLISGRGCRPTSPPRTPKMALGAARRDTSNISRGSQPWPTVMAATTRKRVAPVWRVSRPPQAAASTRHGRLQTTSRDSSRRLVQTTCTLSSTS